MNRRTFVRTSAAALLTFKTGARAQPRPRNLPRVGILLDSHRPGLNDPLAAFRRGLRDLGYVEGQDLLLEHRSADDALERLPSLVSELFRLHISVLLAGGSAAARVAMMSTGTIPIVFADVNDPIVEGLVTDVRRPSGNITGLSAFESELNAKRLGLMTEFMPRARRIAVLVDRDVPPTTLTMLRRAADRSWLTLQIAAAGNSEELGSSLDVAKRTRAQALVVVPSRTFSASRASLIAVVKKMGWPSIYPHRDFVESGGVMSYGPKVPEMYASAARYVLSLLQGARISDLPVEQAKLELGVNLRAAYEQRLSVPTRLVARADYVIR